MLSDSMRLRDGVLYKEQFQCLDLTAVLLFVRELSCRRGRNGEQ